MVIEESRVARSRRLAAEREIEDSALELFLARGFAETTMADVATAAGISRSSLFRYFSTKEDLLLAPMRETSGRLVADLRKRPSDEDAWTALTHVLIAFAAEFDAGGETARRRARLLADTPGLRDAMAGKHREWQEVFASALTERLTGPEDARLLQAQAITASALSCLDVAVTAWARSASGPSAAALLRSAVETISALR